MKLRWSRLLAMFALVPWAVGCADGFRPPEQIPLCVEAPSHPNVTLSHVTSEGTSDMLQMNGAYILYLPGEGFGYCDFFGIPLQVPPFTCDPECGEYVIIKDNDLVVRKLPVSRIRKLPQDSEGRRIIEVK